MNGVRIGSPVGGLRVGCSRMIKELEPTPGVLMEFTTNSIEPSAKVIQYEDGSVAMTDANGDNPEYLYNATTDTFGFSSFLPLGSNVYSCYPNNAPYWTLYLNQYPGQLYQGDGVYELMSKIDKTMGKPNWLPEGTIVERMNTAENGGFDYGVWTYIGTYRKEYSKGAAIVQEVFLYQRTA